ncbi:MAG: RHS repeat domain-containing protein [Candidatus Binatia bacterium]
MPTAAIHHYHLDHLGSPQTITTGTGTVYQHLRYMPYGDLRGTWSAGGGSGGPTTEQDRHLFTGYELEPRSNLHYAGARFYDADFGLFLTHDPARQFANPYTYTNWDPINRTDPSGAFTGIELATIAAVAFVAGFAAGAIQAAVNGASFPEALKAGAISGAIAGVSAPIGAVVLQYAIGPALGAMTGLTAAEAADAAGTALFIGSLRQAAYGLSQGDYSGIISLGISVGIGLALAQGANSDAAGGDTLHNGRGEAGARGGGQAESDLFRPTKDDVAQSLKDLEAHREALRFEGLSPSQVSFDPGLPTNQGQTHCGLFGGCTVRVSETFTNRAEFTATLWHESVHVHRGWLGRLSATQHLRLVGYDGEVINAFRTGDFGRLNLPATRSGGLDLSVPGPMERPWR